MKTRVGAAFTYAAVLCLAFTRGEAALAGTGDPVLLNEVLASHTGTDDTEFIELFGVAGTSLDGLSLIVVEGDGSAAGTIDRQIDFGPTDALRSDGFYLVGNPVGLAANYGVSPAVSIGNDFFENSSLTVALVQTASILGTAVTGLEVVLDAVALSDGGTGDVFFFGAPVLGPDGAFFPAGARRLADGVDTDTAADWELSDFFLGSGNTPGRTNSAIVTTIMQIQGLGQRSPLEGQPVVTSGVVTLYSANGRDFWLQDPSGDGDPSTSDGIVVDDGGLLPGAPTVGDLISITAVVEEQQFGTALPLTRLDAPSGLSILSSGNPLPAPVELDDLPDELITEGIEFWEPLEGMRVAVRNAPVVAPTTPFGEFAMLAKTDAKEDRGSGFYEKTSQILIRSLGNGEVDYNPERILVDDTSLDEPLEVAPGDRVRELVGVVDYTFSAYKLQPESFDVKRQDLPNVPASTRSGPPGNAVLATLNVGNLFDLFDNPDKDDEGNTPTPEELDTKLSKLALAIELELELPEILVVQGAENTSILQDLGDRVNMGAGANYWATSFETSDPRGIEVGFLWDSDRVMLLSASQLSGPDVDAAFGPGSPSPGREPLVGEFWVYGNQITIIGNHFTSKAGDDPLYGINQPPVRITEIQRKAQAQVVRDFVNSILDADPTANVMVAGDLNDFQFAEPGEGSDHPVAILEGAAGEIPLMPLIDLEKPPERYTFIFDGNSEVLDHMLVSPGLFGDVAAVDILHFNARIPAALASDPTSPLRSSDHDPIEARLKF